MTVVIQETFAHPCFHSAERLWGLSDGVEDSPGFIGPQRRWERFTDAHDAAEAINRERHGTYRGLWT